jgi:hypothetical protein
MPRKLFNKLAVGTELTNRGCGACTVSRCCCGVTPTPAPEPAGPESGSNLGRERFDLLILRDRSPGVRSSFKLDGKKSSRSPSSAAALELIFIESPKKVDAGSEPAHALGRWVPGPPTPDDAPWGSAVDEGG